MRGDGRAALAFLAPNIMGFLVFTLLPIAASLVLSLYQWPLIGEPTFRGLDNFVRLATADPLFIKVLVNTVIFAVCCVVLGMGVSLGLALWLTTRIRFRAAYRVLFFLPVVTPMVANAIVWRLMYAPDDGILNWLIQSVTGLEGPNWLGSPTWAMPAMIVMSVWSGFGYNMLIFIAGIEAIPASLRDAALLDGTNRWQRFRHVILPLLSPSIFFALVMTLITSFQVFTQPYVLTGGGPGSSTTTLVQYLYDWGFTQYQMGYASAIAWVLFLIIMTVTVAQFRLQRRWVNYE